MADVDFTDLNQLDQWAPERKSRSLALSHLTVKQILLSIATFIVGVIIVAAIVLLLVYVVKPKPTTSR